MPSPSHARALAPALLALVLGLAPASAARAQGISPAATSRDDTELGTKLDTRELVDAGALLQLWGTRLGATLVADPQLAGTKLHFVALENPLTWGMTKAVLDFNDVVVEERDVGGHDVLFARLRRNLASTCAPPFPVLDLGTEPVPQRNEVVTAVLRVRNGAGNNIFGTVRGLLVRDVNRVGNILYVRGPEAIILVDFAANVDYYAKIIRALDTPAPALPARSFKLANAWAGDVAAELQEIYGPSETAKPQAGGPVCPPSTVAPRFSTDVRTNSVVVTAPTADLATIERLVTALDEPPALPPAPRAESWTSSARRNVWRIAAACATLAFLGQTLILRRLQRQIAIRKM